MNAKALLTVVLTPRTSAPLLTYQCAIAAGHSGATSSIDVPRPQQNPCYSGTRTHRPPPPAVVVPSRDVGADTSGTCKLLPAPVVTTLSGLARPWLFLSFCLCRDPFPPPFLGDCSSLRPLLPRRRSGSCCGAVVATPARGGTPRCPCTRARAYATPSYGITSSGYAFHTRGRNDIGHACLHA